MISEPLLGPTALLSINKLGKRYRNEDAPIWLRPIALRSQPGGYGYEIMDVNWRKCLPFQSIGHRMIDPVANNPNTIPPRGAFKTGAGQETDGKNRYEDLIHADLMAGVGNKNGIRIGSYVVRSGKVFGANTLEELADMIGLDSEGKANMLAEVAEYNQMCKKGKDTRYGKDPQKLFPIENPPFFACGAGLTKSPTGSDVGLITDGKLAVTRKQTGKPIGGLWAVGICLGQRHAFQYLTPMSGLYHGYAVTFGKLVGEFIAKV
jgi:hypothetical protein